MENLTDIQADILAKAVAEAWDDLPDAGEVEYGPATERKAREAVLAALKKPEVIDIGIKPNEEETEDLVGQFQVYLDSAENLVDLTRMQAELAELFSAE